MPPKPTNKTVTAKGSAKGGKHPTKTPSANAKKKPQQKGKAKGNVAVSSSQEDLKIMKTPEKYIPKITPQEAIKIAKLDGQKCFQSIHIAGKIIELLINKQQDHEFQKYFKKVGKAHSAK